MPTYGEERCLHQQAAAQAARTPLAIAVEAPGERLDYQELEARSNQLARVLARRGVRRESLVGIALEPSVDFVVSVLAVWKAGGAYLPLDARYPRARLELMLGDAGPALVLSHGRLLAELPIEGLPVLELDRQAAEVSAASKAPLDLRVEDHQLAYVIYTSGSGGRPKGVALEHRGLAALRQANLAAGSGGARRVLQFAPLAFDASLSEMVLALAFGGVLCIPPREARVGFALVDFLRRARIDCAVLPPSTLAALPFTELPELAMIIAAGEVCPQAVVDRWAPGRTFFNHYGPTEATVWSTVARCVPGQKPTIGRAILGVETHVLDARMTPVAIGEVGELYIGGVGVARGYFRQPSLSAERFVANPFGPGRLYQSGDRVRVLPGGELDFVGRVDRQLKLRGLRVDPGEVEAALCAVAGVREAAVVAQAERLVAYVAATPPPTALRTQLASNLPEPLVPTLFAYLEALPRTPSGKVDYAGLPAPQRAIWRRPYVAPGQHAASFVAAEWERWLSPLFAEVLGTSRVGADEDFFELGGHSLVAVGLLTRISFERGVTLPLATLLLQPTVRGLAAALASAAPGTPAARVVPAHEGVCSSVEQRLLFVDALEPGLAVYNTPLLVELRGRGGGDVEALARALGEIVRRHEILRTNYSDDDGMPRAVAGRADAVPISIVDLRQLDPGELDLRVAADARRPFDMRRGPLLRATVFRLADDVSAALVIAHHLVFDGWSRGVLVRELLALHAQIGAGREPALPSLPLQYRQWAGEEARRLLGTAPAPLVDYWRSALAGAQPPQLPTDRAPPPLRRHPGVRVPLCVEGWLVCAVGALAREERATPFMVLCAALQVLLARHSGETDITIGTPVANRGNRELEGLIGCFVNTIALRTSVAGSPSFRTLLRRVREASLGAYAHQDLPFERVVAALSGDRSAQASPLVRVMLVHDDTLPPPETTDALDVRVSEPFNGCAMFDLMLAFSSEGDGLRGFIECDLELFDAGTAERLAERFQRLLEAAVTRPEEAITRLPLTGSDDLRAFAEWNDTSRVYRARAVHEPFVEQAARTPSAEAVISGSTAYSYRELDRRSDQLANHLLGCGVPHGGLVGISLEESVDKAVAVLGVLKAGAACVPLDPSYPPERLRLTQADAGVSVVITRELITEASMAADTPPGVTVSPDDLVYVLHTSGSTGRPKGVALAHRAFTNLVEWHQRTLPAGLRTLQFSPLSFDVSFYEMFTTWASGGVVVMTDGRVRHDVCELAHVIDSQGVEKVIVPVVVLHLLADAFADDATTLGSLREVIATGEQLRITSPVVRLFARLGKCRLHNHYGPTETHVVTAHTLEGAPASWPALPPIGRPIANTQIHIVGAGGVVAPLGAAGELLIGGDSLARGYWGRPGLTADRFVPDPFGARSGGRLYRTGDLARWRADGTLEFLGRLDRQLKVRGFRVEPGEVETVLCQHPRVRLAAVVLRDQRLLAYVVPEGDVSASEIVAFAATQLPDYMVPAAVTSLAALPRTPSGKVDLGALPQPLVLDHESGHVAPRNPIEARIVEIWAAQLGSTRIGVHDNFFELGGHSLIATCVMTRISRAFGIVLSPRELFEHPTVAALADRIEELLVREVLDAERSQ